MRSALLSLLLLGCAKPQAAPPSAPAPTAETRTGTIGTATMAGNRAIRLQLVSHECDGTIAHGDFTVRPDEARYAEILRHLGGLAPGQSKPVPAWPEPPCR